MAQSKPIQTRQITECPIFGAFIDLSDDLLPTYEDFMKYNCFIRHNLKVPNGKDLSVSQISDNLVPRVESIWSRATIYKIIVS